MTSPNNLSKEELKAEFVSITDWPSKSAIADYWLKVLADYKAHLRDNIQFKIRYYVKKRDEMFTRGDIKMSAFHDGIIFGLHQL